MIYKCEDYIEVKDDECVMGLTIGYLKSRVDLRHPDAAATT
jgi:hypothetical protein